MGVSDEAKNVIPLKFFRKIKNKNFFPLVNSIRGHTVDCTKNLTQWQYLFFVLVALKTTLPTSNARSETSASRSTRM
jgi:hypothetical protein